MIDDQPKKHATRHAYTVRTEKEIYSMARHIMVEEKRFLQPYLTLEVLAGEMNIHRNALSAAINRLAGVSFPMWVASLRIAEVERLAGQPENAHTTIQSLALKAGFSSRTSFNRVYSSLRRASPSEMLPGRRKIKNK